MSKLVIEVNFEEDILESELFEIEHHLSGLISEEFIYYGEEYPEAEIKSYWKEKK